MGVGSLFADRLFAAGILLRTGVDGLYGRSAVYERVVNAVDGLITRLGATEDAEVMRFPPGLNRAEFERSGYLKGFPQLAGTVHCFCGGEAEHRSLLRCVAAGEDWMADQQPAAIVLTPAACYPAYPILAARGRLPTGGALLDVGSWCFRHEPSIEPTRQLMFRMREYVRIGAPEAVVAFRQLWLDRVRAMAERLALPHEVDVANDPFFGRGGRVLAQSQREQALKFELLIPVNDGAGPTACASFNYHMDHFAQAFGLRREDGSSAHSACVGFGMERLALALFRHHGLDPASWPPAIRGQLWP